MAQDTGKKVKFVRIRGKVRPIRSKNGDSKKKAAPPGAKKLKKPKRAAAPRAQKEKISPKFVASVVGAGIGAFVVKKGASRLSRLRGAGIGALVGGLLPLSSSVTPETGKQRLRKKRGQ